ncbi:hypothetical protein T484DRAFT_1827902 [Baffinella frigidus]|nr:hypothetical protein T484DRAFT_1827902 [Cryptophyta sp. CCMP2293]
MAHRAISSMMRGVLPQQTRRLRSAVAPPTTALQTALARLDRSAAPASVSGAQFKTLAKYNVSNNGVGASVFWQKWAEHMIKYQGNAEETLFKDPFLQSDSLKLIMAQAFWTRQARKENKAYPVTPRLDLNMVPLKLKSFEDMLREEGLAWGKEVVVPNATAKDKPAVAKVIITSYMAEAVELIVEAPPDAAGVTRRQLAASIVDMFGVVHATEAEWLSRNPEALARHSARLLATASSEAKAQARERGGQYGLWGHGLGDLMIENVVHVPELDAYLLEVGS